MIGADIAVLLVDDDEGVCEAIQHVFFDEDAIDLTTITKPSEALELLDEREFDIVISDFKMPGMNGLELMERVRRGHPDCVRILLSGQVDLTEVTSAFNTGLISQFLVKPWRDDEELLSAVQIAARTRKALLQSHALLAQYQHLREQMDSLGQAVTATCLALRHDSVVAQDGEFLRRSLNRRGSDE